MADTEEKAPETPATPPVVEKPAEPAKVTLDATDYSALFKRLTEAETRLGLVDAEKQAAVEKEREKYLKELGETKGLATALEEAKKIADEDKAKEKKRADDLESSWLAEKKENVLASAVAGREFVSPEARDQALAILSVRFDVKRVDGRIVVQDRQTGQFASQSVPALLDTPAFAHFQKAKGGGGSGATGGSTPPPEETQTKPANLGEFLIAETRKAMAESGQRKFGYFGR